MICRLTGTRIAIITVLLICAGLSACGGRAEEIAQTAGPHTGAAGQNFPVVGVIASSSGGGAGGGGAPSAPSSAGDAELDAGGQPAAEGGAAGDAPDGLEPIRIIRGGTEQDYSDLILLGEGLANYEGAVVTARIGGYPQAACGTDCERLGSGQARIKNGGFKLVFPKVWETGNYKQKLVFIDVDRDGVCSPNADLVYGDWSASPRPDGFFRVPADFSVSDAPLRDCETFNKPWPLK